MLPWGGMQPPPILCRAPLLPCSACTPAQSPMWFCVWLINELPEPLGGGAPLTLASPSMLEVISGCSTPGPASASPWVGTRGSGSG